MEARSGFVPSALRTIEIALTAIESRPATNAWLFDAAFQAKISFDIPCLYRSRANVSTSTVSFELSTIACSSFWMNEPKHIISAIRAMFESTSFDIPRPTGCPIALSFGAAFSTLSQLVGLRPTSPQRSAR